MIDGGRHTFMKVADDKLYYDEKRKRFVSTADMPGHAFRSYYQGHFKVVSINYPFRKNHRLPISRLSSTIATPRSLRQRAKGLPTQAQVRPATHPPNEQPDQARNEAIVEDDGWNGLHVLLPATWRLHGTECGRSPESAAYVDLVGQFKDCELLWRSSLEVPEVRSWHPHL